MISTYKIRADLFYIVPVSVHSGRRLNGREKMAASSMFQLDGWIPGRHHLHCWCWWFPFRCFPLQSWWRPVENSVTVKAPVKSSYFSLYTIVSVILLVTFLPKHPFSVVCIWYLPIPVPHKGRVVEEYQHWLHKKLMDFLPNSYSIYFPSGVPSVSFPLPLLNFLNSLFHSHSAFLCPCHPLPPSRLFSHLLCLFFSVPHCHLPTT